MTSPSQPSSDRDLVERCVAGDSHAWRTLYERHFPQVIRFVSGLGVAAEEREDAVQDVFIAVYRSLPGFRGDAQLSTWIYRIAARHVARMGSRRRLRETLASLLWREYKHAPQVVTTHEAVEHAHELRVLDDMLGRLSQKKRMVVVLFEIEGLPVEEVAQIVGCPVNTVWSRLHHARRELAKMAKTLCRTTQSPRASDIWGGLR